MFSAAFRRAAFLVACLPLAAFGQEAKVEKPDEPPEFPPFEEVSKDYERVTTPDGASYYTLWRRDKDAQLLAELPREFEGKRFWFGPTVAAGDEEAGVLTMYTRWGGAGDRYVYWSRYDKRLALIEPNLTVRSTGDDESKAATERVFTDHVVLDVGILCMGPGGGPVIDLDELFIGRADRFFGSLVEGANSGLSKIVEAKAFPKNIEVSIELPVQDGRLVTLHYSLSDVPQETGYEPRRADRRVGFFYTNFEDRARNDGDPQTVRYIQRWHLEKADPKLNLSPPKKPIVFYIEHTTPVRYRRWVKDGILEWNRAFERVGIVGAIEVYQQDATTGAHMEKDPEDVRYNFLRWTNAHMGYAIGPSRVNPETGEILDADIVMDEGFISGWTKEFFDILPETAMRGLDEATIEWLGANPEWDPRTRLGGAPPAQRPAPVPTLLQRTLQGADRSCVYARGRTTTMGLARLAVSAGLLPAGGEGGEGLLDGVPEEFIGPLLKDVIMHEVGHTLGLMHNFKASSIYTIQQINSPEWKGKKPLAGSVMDYLADNIWPDPKAQGDYCMIGIGPYDLWAIEWGYTSGDPVAIAKRAAEPELAFLSDESAWGPDPQSKVWELGGNSLDWARSQVQLVGDLRAKLLDRTVKEGQSWERARRGYEMLLSIQMRGLAAATYWVGSASVARDHKGDPNMREPLTVTPAVKQRAALAFVLENAFRDEAYGLTPQLMARLGSDEWWEDSGFLGGAAWPVHDRVLGIQSSVLSRLMNPMVLGRVYDNEIRTPATEDTLTMPELLGAIRAEVWSELKDAAARPYTARQPMISSMRRNLQREHLNRLVGLATGERLSGWTGASARSMVGLVRQELRDLKAAIEKAPLQTSDPYTRAHLTEAMERITRALEAAYLRQD